MTQSTEKTFLIDPLNTNNAIYWDSWPLKVKKWGGTKCFIICVVRNVCVFFQNNKERSKFYLTSQRFYVIRGYLTASLFLQLNSRFKLAFKKLIFCDFLTKYLPVKSKEKLTTQSSLAIAIVKLLVRKRKTRFSTEPNINVPKYKWIKY